jgi:mRNA interferase MazF
MTSVRGDVHELPAPRHTRGHEQKGRRYAVVLQSDDLPLSTLLIAPTSTAARPTSFRPAVDFGRGATLVLVEQTTAVVPGRLGPWVGRLTYAALADVDAALRLVLTLD